MAENMNFWGVKYIRMELLSLGIYVGRKWVNLGEEID
jgi:hypothetical protein